MRFKIITLFITIIFLWSCRPTSINSVSANNGALTSVKLVEIKLYKSVNQIKAVTEKADSIFLISYNRKEYEIDTSKFIKLGLVEVNRFRVGTMKALGAYMIVGNDTLWSGPSTKNAPKFYKIIEQ